MVIRIIVRQRRADVIIVRRYDLTETCSPYDMVICSLKVEVKMSVLDHCCSGDYSPTNDKPRKLWY